MALRQIMLRATAAASVISLSYAAVCFYPDGITTESNHSPCNATIESSACCDPLDSCSISGICLGRSGFNYRGSCTDRTWESENCPSKFCVGDPFNNVEYADFTPLWPCDKPGAPSSSFCCNSPGRNCCEIATFELGETGNAFKGGVDLMLAQIANLTEAANATVTITATAALSTHTGLTASSSSNNSSSNLGLPLGLGIGLPLGLLAIGLIAFLFWKEKNHSKADAEARMKVLEMDPGNNPYAKSINDSTYLTPGPLPIPPVPPKPPVPQMPDEGTWNQQDTFISRTSSAKKSPGIRGGETVVHELI